MAWSSLAATYPQGLLEELKSHACDRAESAIKTAMQILERARKKVEATHKLPIGEPPALILDSAETWGADLIAGASHGRRGLDRLLYGQCFGNGRNLCSVFRRSHPELTTAQLTFDAHSGTMFATGTF